MRDKLLTKKELARELGLSTKTIERWQKKGLPVVRLGTKYLRYQYDSVIAWLVNGN